LDGICDLLLHLRLFTLKLLHLVFFLSSHEFVFPKDQVLVVPAAHWLGDGELGPSEVYFSFRIFEVGDATVFFYVD